jgi:hypothetical protein
MNLENLISTYKNNKIGNPDSAVPIKDLPLDVLSSVVNLIAANYDLEDEKYATKEKVFYDTRRIVARSNYNKNSNQIYSNLDFDDKLTEIVQPIVKEINVVLPSVVPILTQVATLLPGQSLQWHTDVFLYQQFTNKLHIPLISNSDSFFDVFVNDSFVKRINMTPGLIYNIDNLALHRSINKGSSIRTHLIIDVMELSTLDALLNTGINFFHTKLPAMSEIEKVSLEKLSLKYNK